MPTTYRFKDSELTRQAVRELLTGTGLEWRERQKLAGYPVIIKDEDVPREVHLKLRQLGGAIDAG